MPNLQEIAERKAKAALRHGLEEDEKARKARLAKIAARKAAEAVRLERSKLVGKIIDDADLAGELTPQEKAMIGLILSRCAIPPGKAYLLSGWSVAPEPARPDLAKPDAVVEAAE
jgi:hypothetical protein